MICLDTTVLIDEFRARGDTKAAVNQALLAHGSENLIVPVVAAGEFLDRAAMVSEQRFQDALLVLRQRKIAGVDLETAQHYGRIVVWLRQRKALAGKSQNNLWIGATAKKHGAKLITRNARDFDAVSGLEVLGYAQP